LKIQGKITSRFSRHSHFSLSFFFFFSPQVHTERYTTHQHCAVCTQSKENPLQGAAKLQFWCSGNRGRGNSKVNSQGICKHTASSENAVFYLCV